MGLIKKIYRRLSQREYRPTRLFRIPIYVIGIFFAIKARHPRFFSLVNPKLQGGFMNEPKSLTLGRLDPRHRPKSVSIVLPKDRLSVHHMIQQSTIMYPLVIKPDGDSVRGEHVYIVHEEKERNRITGGLPGGSYIIQEYIDGEEYSVYYYRHPNQQTGKILGITKKVYPHVIGDGISTLQQLIMANDRYHRYYSIFLDKFAFDPQCILAVGQSHCIGRIGNHSKGALFLDRSNHTTPGLVAIFDTLYQSEHQMHLYRVDLKTPSREHLLKGDFHILETNAGVFAEPTYVYDPNYSLWKAYYEFGKVWLYSYRITQYYHNKKISYIGLKQGRMRAKRFLKL